MWTAVHVLLGPRNQANIDMNLSRCFRVRLVVGYKRDSTSRLLLL